MALIDCPECQARVSDAAPACIKCGFPFAAPKDGAVRLRSSTTPAPRTDGLYVTESVVKQPRAFGIFRTGYSRGYIRFLSDGLMLFGGSVVKQNPEPAPFPTMHRDSAWAADDRTYRWAVNGERVRITTPTGGVHYAMLDGSRLVWDWLGDAARSVFLFHEFEWPDR